jgi:hypothetical protein
MVLLTPAEGRAALNGGPTPAAQTPATRPGRGL